MCLSTFLQILRTRPAQIDVLWLYTTSTPLLSFKETIVLVRCNQAFLHQAIFNVGLDVAVVSENSAVEVVITTRIFLQLAELASDQRPVPLEAALLAVTKLHREVDSAFVKLIDPDHQRAKLRVEVNRRPNAVTSPAPDQPEAADLEDFGVAVRLVGDDVLHYVFIICAKKGTIKLL